MPTLRSACAVVSPPGRPYAEDPATLSYYRDLVEPFGAVVEEDLLRQAPQVSHCDLIDLLVSAPGVGDSAPDLVIVAQALPDLTPFTAIGPYLDRKLGGGATNFGIHQQGLAAPYTALRVISAFQRAGRSRTALLAVLEQTTLPSRFGLVHDHGLIDSGVMLVLDSSDGPQVTDVQTVPAHVPAVDRIRALLAEDPQGTLVVTGPWFDRSGLDGTPHHHPVEPGSYCTGVWLPLALNWRAWTKAHSTVVLCDTDPRSGESHLAVLRSAAGGPDDSGRRTAP